MQAKFTPLENDRILGNLQKNSYAAFRSFPVHKGIVFNKIVMKRYENEKKRLSYSSSSF